MFSRFKAWTTQTRPGWHESPTEGFVIFCVFGITGSTSVAVVRPTFEFLTGIKGSFKDGPWSYRFGSLLLISPAYALLLVTIGTLAGRHQYFGGLSWKILTRLLPNRIMQPLLCQPAKSTILKKK